MACFINFWSNKAEPARASLFKPGLIPWNSALLMGADKTRVLGKKVQNLAAT